MSRKGFDFPPPSDLAPVPVPRTPPNALRYGVITPQMVDMSPATWAYYATGIAPDRSSGSNSRWSEAQTIAQYGGTTPRSTGGCASQAAAKLSANGGNYGEGESLTYVLERDSFKASQKDSRVRAAFAAWSACMSTKGYSVKSPIRDQGAPQPSRDQLLAEVECKQSVGLVDVWSTVESGLQERLVSQHVHQLDVAKRQFEVTLHNAEAVVHSAG